MDHVMEKVRRPRPCPTTPLIISCSLRSVVEKMPLVAVGVSGIGRVVTAVQGTTVIGHGVQAVHNRFYRENRIHELKESGGKVTFIHMARHLCMHECMYVCIYTPNQNCSQPVHF